MNVLNFSNFTVHDLLFLFYRKYQQFKKWTITNQTLKSKCLKVAHLIGLYVSGILKTTWEKGLLASSSLSAHCSS